MRAAGSLPRAAMRLLQLALLSLGAGEAKAFGAAVRWGRADLAEVCCCSDSVLSGEVERLGGRTLRYSHWNGFDLSTGKGYEACAASLRTERPRWTWFATPCTMDSQLQHLNDHLYKDDPVYLEKKKEKMRRSIRIQRNVVKLYLLCLAEGLSSPVLEQPWTSGSWKREFRRLRDQFHLTRTDGCAWGMRDPQSRELIQKAWGDPVSGS